MNLVLLLSFGRLDPSEYYCNFAKASNFRRYFLHVFMSKTNFRVPEHKHIVYST